MIHNHTKEAGKLVDHTTGCETSVSPVHSVFPEQAAGAVARTSHAQGTLAKAPWPTAKTEEQANTKEDDLNCMTVSSFGTLLSRRDLVQWDKRGRMIALPASC